MVLENGNKLLRYAAEFDPTRPIFSNLGSVFLDSQGGGKIDLGKIYEPITSQISPFESHKFRLGYPVSQRTYNMLANYCSSKESKLISDGIHGNKSFWERYNYLKDEVGGKVLVDGIGSPVFGDIAGQLEASKPYSSFQDYKDVQKFVAELNLVLKDKDLKMWKDALAFMAAADEITTSAMKQHIEALLINPQISGYIIENWGDYGMHFTGLANWQRQPKKALIQVLSQINRPIHIFAEAEDRTPYIGSSASIKIHLINEAQLGDYSVQFKVKGPSGRVLHQETVNGKAKPGYNSVGRFKFPVGMERGRFTFDLTLTRQGKEVGKVEEQFFVPAEVKLDVLLKKVSLLGNFHDTVSYSTVHDTPITVASDLTDVTEDTLKKALARAFEGGTLILGAMGEEDVKKWNSLKAFGTDLICFRSTGATPGNFHYMKESSAFKDLPTVGLLDQMYSEVQPHWSLDHLPTSEVIAGSLNINGTAGAKSKIRWGADIALAPYGKGKVIFYQYDIFGKLGKNALADALFANLIQQLT